MSGYLSVPGLEVALDGSTLALTLDRSAKRNAIDDVMMAGLIDLVERAGQDEDVRVILLRGAGKDFCGGADIVARNTRGGDGAEAPRRPRTGSIQRRLPTHAHRLIPLIQTVQTPVVCAVRGWAAGFGLALALAADVTVADTDATFWAPFAARGFTPDSGLTWLLPRRIGEVRSRRMLLLGDRIDAPTAVDWGLIDQAVAPDELDAAVRDVTGRLAAGPTVALGLSKWLLSAGTSTSLDEHLRNEAFAMELSSRSEDFREGFAAFTAKRPPAFKGR